MNSSPPGQLQHLDHLERRWGAWKPSRWDQTSGIHIMADYYGWQLMAGAPRPGKRDIGRHRQRGPHHPHRGKVVCKNSAQCDQKHYFSLIGDLEFPPNCNPSRPYPGLWNYEVLISPHCHLDSWPFSPHISDTGKLTIQSCDRWWRRSSSTQSVSAMLNSSSILVERILPSFFTQSNVISI